MTRGSYPHPVLDDSDDVGSQFEATNFQVAPSHEDVELTWEIRTDDPDVQRLLADGDARHSLQWTCSATMSTDEVDPQIHKRDGGITTLRTWIDQQRIRDHVDVELRIIANREINGHSWIRQHPDYGGASFHFAKGDVIAHGGTVRFHAHKLFDPLDPPIGSCFDFRENPKVRKGMRINFSGSDTIVVELSPNLTNDLRGFSGAPEVQIATAVLPALMETIHFIARNESDPQAENLEDRTWYTAIREQIDQHGGLEKGPLELAQRILAHPIDRALSGLTSQEDDQ